MAQIAPARSGTADDTGVTFHLADRPHRLASVCLRADLAPHAGSAAEPVPFDRVPGGWSLRLDRPAVDRMEYLLEITDHNGRSRTLVDPTNPLRTAGTFGDKSVVEFAGYRRPAWLDAARVRSASRQQTIDGVDVVLWAPHGLAPRAAAPLLVVHDGPEYARLGGLTAFLAAGIEAGALPPLRAALLDPADRNDEYAADEDYAERLCTKVVPEIAVATVRIAVGASLGALAALHAHRRHPGTFDALFLQSGSFFTAELDAQESGFEHFTTITGFVAEVQAADTDPAPVPVAQTCGTVEENLANNVEMHSALCRLGYPATFAQHRDAHNFVAWRDALHPSLSDLIAVAYREGQS